MAVGRRRKASARRKGKTPLPNWDQYAYRWTALHGGIDPRRSRGYVERWLRLGYVLAKICARLGARPGTVTALGLLACVLVPWCAKHGGGWALVAAGLVLFSAVADTVDGALAVLTDHTTRLGYVYDAVADRLAEVFWLLALAHLGMPPWIGVVACGMSWLHEYTRSRANAAGMTEIGAATIGERPTRVLLTVVGLALAGLLGAANPVLPRGIASFAGAAWLVLSILGFMQLFASIHRALAGRSWPSHAPLPSREKVSPFPDTRAAVELGPDGYPALPASTALYLSNYSGGDFSGDIGTDGDTGDGT